MLTIKRKYPSCIVELDRETVLSELWWNFCFHMIGVIIDRCAIFIISECDIQYGDVWKVGVSDNKVNVVDVVEIFMCLHFIWNWWYTL